ncbi:LEAF RUST 10 DISEASE-RESISTANCE LOCUS RECEPTOR-LIKE PROTEIN KINASE-like 1.4 [Neltuma alba]|uniref:LEAF RUST 10 DISEASE-RESISTANCE LOCUS RECEPTOR-LIKE PROTEIN KINASE-like 1.4 n=1 Tax=Neltuma alba TaxID=207710 RepID=UPI0010A399D9|nr:LEAF RUST 10 DISEASE-RESISTANCE LOCUS RECEPTOR-LIKE PROTEIN KINASE-like 1.4 [Prosopis alba]
MGLISLLPTVDMGRNEDEIMLVDPVDPCLEIEEDCEVKKKMFVVGELAFQCLQVNNKMRPSIDEVLEILKKIESEKEEGGNVEEDKAETNTLPLETPITMIRQSC